MELVISVVISVLLVELYAWLPQICELLLEHAVRRLPLDERARWREEWRADLRAMPNSFAQLLHAVGYRFAAFAIAREMTRGRAGVDGNRAHWATKDARELGEVMGAQAGLSAARFLNYLEKRLFRRRDSNNHYDKS
jgi:hypothetical protein